MAAFHRAIVFKNSQCSQEVPLRALGKVLAGRQREHLNSARNYNAMPLPTFSGQSYARVEVEAA